MSSSAGTADMHATLRSRGRNLSEGGSLFILQPREIRCCTMAKRRSEQSSGGGGYREITTSKLEELLPAAGTHHALHPSIAYRLSRMRTRKSFQKVFARLATSILEKRDIPCPILSLGGL